MEEAAAGPVEGVRIGVLQEAITTWPAWGLQRAARWSAIRIPELGSVSVSAFSVRLLKKKEAPVGILQRGRPLRISSVRIHYDLIMPITTKVFVTVNSGLQRLILRKRRRRRSNLIILRKKRFIPVVHAVHVRNQPPGQHVVRINALVIRYV